MAMQAGLRGAELLAAGRDATFPDARRAVARAPARSWRRVEYATGAHGR